MGSLSAWHWLVVLVVVVLLFGSSKLPQMARSLGQSARVLKAEARGLRDDDQAAQRDNTEAEPGSPRGSAESG
ncbi:Sec-independent protein translocase subunit TatA [Saccharopolyspora dendranthemae]|uniref:Sec-independent protein translocase protein TatA n=1 Tax=Saccharopolyspora dendranthemae TaxID=1181886 RepID=A0A561U3D9_9PSEU|nr:Sec-independent protein translocase subunit TatA [Saccharopolyspora dendranthemae]TWF93860.1 sec-independent protein translocase protein TatA [Saccharopolyspora dendranthemae]